MKKITLLVLLSCVLTGFAGCIFHDGDMRDYHLSYNGSRLSMHVVNGCERINHKPIESINGTAINHNDCVEIVSVMKVKAHLRDPNRVYDNTECHAMGSDIDCSFGWNPVYFANAQRNHWKLYFSSTVLKVLYKDGTTDDADFEITKNFDVSTIREVAPADYPLSLCDGTCGDGQHCDATQNKCVADDLSGDESATDSNSDGGGGCSLNPKAASKAILLPMLLVLFLGLGVRKYLKAVIPA